MYSFIVISFLLLVWIEYVLQFNLEDGWKLQFYAVCATILNGIHLVELILYTMAFGVSHIV